MPRENVYAYRYSRKYFILNLGLSRFGLIFIPEQDNNFRMSLDVYFKKLI